MQNMQAWQVLLRCGQQGIAKMSSSPCSYGATLNARCILCCQRWLLVLRVLSLLVFWRWSPRGTIAAVG